MRFRLTKQIHRGMRQRAHWRTRRDQLLGRAVSGGEASVAEWVGCCNEGDSIADRFQPARPIAGRAFGIAPVKVISTALVIFNTLFGEDIPGNDEDAMGYGNGGLLDSTPLPGATESEAPRNRRRDHVITG